MACFVSQRYARLKEHCNNLCSWTVGNTWPDDGEIDIIEGWNLQTTNAPAFHTGDSDEFGTCKLDGSGQTATVDTPNCDNTYSDDDQSLNQGCTGDDTAAPYGLSEGGVCK